MSKFCWLLLLCVSSLSSITICGADPVSLRVAAEKSLARGATKAATKYAKACLKENAAHRKSWQYGNNIHEANQVLGLAALHEKRMADAKRYLIAAGKTPGSPQLDSFGPHMVLAQALLSRGEKQVVIQYLDLVGKFWAHTPETQLHKIEKTKPGVALLLKRLDKEHQQQIDDWKRQIQAGQSPQLNDSDSLD